MVYKIIRIEDGCVVDISRDRNKADLILFFYDSPETPHKLEVE